MKKNIKLVIINALLSLIVMIAIFIFIIKRGTFSLIDEDAIHFISTACTGGNDAMIIESNGHYGLVDASNPYNDADAGSPGNDDTKIAKCTVVKVMEYIDDLNIQKFDFIVATHSHYNHIGGMEAIAGKYVDSNTKYYYRTYITTQEDTDYPEWNNQKFNTKSITAMQNMGAQLVEVTNKTINFTFENFTINILNTEEYGPNDLAYAAYQNSSVAYSDNANSLGVLVTKNNVRAFLAGDIEIYDEGKVKDKICELGSGNCKVDILKAGHHLYTEATSYEFMKALQPEVVISTNNKADRFDTANDHMNYGSMLYMIKNYNTSFYATSYVSTDSNATPALDAIKVKFNNNDYSVTAKPIGKAENASYLSNVYLNNITALRKNNTWHRISKDNRWVYVENGQVVVNTWKQSNDIWYYLGEDAATVIGFKEINDKIYYFDETGIMLNGWQEIEGKWYFFNDSGDMVVSTWKQSADGTNWYYLGQDGAMVTGQQEIDGKEYYFDEDGVMVSGWQEIDGTWYYYNASGDMIKNDWLLSKSLWYYFDGEGKMVTGWHYLDAGNGDEYWYYFNTSGAYKCKIVNSKYILDLDKEYLYTKDETDIGTILSNITYTGGDMSLKNNKLQLKYENEITKEIKIVNISSDDYDLTKNYLFYGNNLNVISQNIDCLNCDVLVNNNKINIKINNQLLDEYTLMGINTNYIIKNNIIYVSSDYGNTSAILNNITSDSCNISFENDKIIIKYNNETIKEYTISNKSDFLTFKVDYNNILHKNSMIYNIYNGAYVKELYGSIDTNADIAVYDNNKLVNNFAPLKTGYTLKATYGIGAINPTTYVLSIRGDVLGEGTMSIDGAKKTAKHIIEANVGNQILKNEYLLAADINGDGNVKMNDVMLMAKNETIDVECSGSYQDGTSTINIKNNNSTELVKYVINGESYETNKITLNNELKTATVKVYTRYGKKDEISCKLEDNNFNPDIKNVSSQTPIARFGTKTVKTNYYSASNGQQFTFYTYIPSTVKRKLPLIVYLVDGGSVGDDYHSNPMSDKGVQYGPIKLITANVETCNAIYIHIQIPADGTGSQYYTASIKELLDKVVKEFDVDKNNISIMGFSNGCYGAISMVNSYGTYFSSAVLIGCNPYNGSASASSFVNVPTWAMSGDDEGTTTLESFVNQINNLGGHGWYNYTATSHNIFENGPKYYPIYQHKTIRWMISPNKLDNSYNGISCS